MSTEDEEFPLLVETKDFEKLIKQARSNPGVMTPWWRGTLFGNKPGYNIIRARFEVEEGPVQGKVVFIAADLRHPWDGENAQIGFGLSPAAAINMLNRKLYGSWRIWKARLWMFSVVLIPVALIGLIVLVLKAWLGH